jgi:UTP:GlnB (protein PII) uridylyltransferase
MFLVRHHLLMAETSRLRDLHLDETIRDFVSIVDDIDRLNMLYLLTYADTNAVGAGVWTQVKGRFLRDLYRRAEHILMAGEEIDDAGLTRTRRRLLKELQVENLPPDEIQEHVESMPAPYILNTSLNDIALHIGFVRRVRHGEPVIDFFDERDSTYTEVTICALDDPEPGLLSKIAGVFYAADIDVHSAQVFTRVSMRPMPEDRFSESLSKSNSKSGVDSRTRTSAKSDTSPSSRTSSSSIYDDYSPLTAHHTPERIAIDTLYVDFRGRQLTPGKRKELATNLTAVLKSEMLVTDLLAKRKKPAEIGGPIESLKVRNDLSETFTVIEVSSADERAMLYRATGALSKLNLDIHSARVSLFKGRSMGSFYLTGAKHRSEADLRAALLNLMPLSTGT